RDFDGVADAFGMDWAFHNPDARMRVLLMVSNFGHCLNDILYRWRIGALPVDIVGVVSNHLTYQKVVVSNDIPFYHIRVTPQT
ncbi:formyltetrahydrofolate deformylase, partial [Xanthomonas citri pv. citri]|nr:formyltetrahydrofolate deformylase [Xanthomonas citri pv. citri]